MASITTGQVLLYGLALLLAILLIGMVGGRTKRDPMDRNPYPVENFDAPNVATASEVAGGSSELYGWGYDPIRSKKTTKKRRQCPNCENVYVDVVDVYVNPPTDQYCNNCDITINKDIDKYVLKSSIPACPDMSQYAKKSEMGPNLNMDEWIRKAEIPPCPPMPDLRDYVRKEDIPPCDLQKECPKCPECPRCPKCPPCPKNVKVVEKVRVRTRKSSW